MKSEEKGKGKEEKRIQEKDVRVRYIGMYVGESPLLHREVRPGEVVVVPNDVANLLISSGQFVTTTDSDSTEVK